MFFPDYRNIIQWIEGKPLLFNKLHCRDHVWTIEQIKTRVNKKETNLKEFLLSKEFKIDIGNDTEATEMSLGNRLIAWYVITHLQVSETSLITSALNKNKET